MNKYFAELLGAFAGDGWMSKGNSGISLFISGNPTDEKEYYNKRIKFLFKKTFHIDVFPRDFSYWGTYGICVGKKEVTKQFILSKMPVGKKCNIVKVPKSIISNPKMHTSFIRGLFDTDGCIYFKKSYNKNASRWQKQTRHRPTVIFSTVSINLAKKVRQMLLLQNLNFGIRTNKPSNGNYNSYELRLEGKENTKRFFALVKPENKRHLNKFKQWLTQGFY